MDSVKLHVSEAKVEGLHCVVETGSDIFLCLTRLDTANDIWIIGVTDGIDVWNTELNIDELDTHRDLAGVSTLDAYLQRFRSLFTSGDINISKESVKISLKVGHGTKALDFELYEATAAKRKTEIQSALFHLAERATNLATKLSSAEQTIESLRQQKTGGAALFDVDVKKKKGQPKAAPKKVGMSVINPGSKKRKAPQGVTFD